MKNILFIIPIFFLAGCGMTFEERKQTIAECEEIGLEWHHYYDGFNNPNVVCVDNSNNSLDEKRKSITEVAVQACIDNGGVPAISNWDGDVICEVIPTSPKQ